MKYFAGVNCQFAPPAKQNPMKSYLLPLLFLVIPAGPLCGQDAGFADSGEPGGTKPLFTSREMVYLDLYTRMDTLLADVVGEASGHPGLLVYQDAAGNRDSFPVSLETRGNFRRNPQNCDFPPLMIRMKEKDVAGTLFEDQDRLKLVTHCRTEQDVFMQFVLQEYLIYRWYNILTPYSYKVRMVYIRYFRLPGRELYTENYGFLIERTRDMAERNGAEAVDFLGLAPNRMEPDMYTLLALFEFLIRNNDWSVEVLHNVKLLSRGPEYPLIPVGYDFDWAGLIEAPYRAQSTRELSEGATAYKGLCREKEDLYRVIDHFLSCKEEMYRVVRDFELLEMPAEQRLLERLDEFFAILESPSGVRRHLIRHCR